MSGMEEQGHLADLVEQLEREAMELDGGGDASGVHLLFRTVHNLKSLSAYVGLAELAGSFHTLEDGLDRIRRDGAMLQRLLERGQDPEPVLEGLNLDYCRSGLTMGGVADCMALTFALQET